MRFYKLRVTPNATAVASSFNEQFKPEIIAEYNDPYRVDWTEHTSSEDVYIGEQVSRMFLSCIVNSLICILYRPYDWLILKRQDIV